MFFHINCGGPRMAPDRVLGQEALPQNHYQTIEGNKDRKEEKTNEIEKW